MGDRDGSSGGGGGSSTGGGDRGTRVYVGGLSDGVKKEDLEDEFQKFGKLNSVWVAFNPPGFAFIEFSSLGDAETACDNLNGTDFLGSKLRVEIARGRGGFRGGRGGRRGSRGSPGSFRSYDRGFRSSRGGSRGGRGRYDDYNGHREERSYSREYSRNGDTYRRGGRDSYRSRGSSSSGGGASGGRRYESSSRYRSRSPQASRR